MDPEPKESSTNVNRGPAVHNGKLNGGNVERPIPNQRDPIPSHQENSVSTRNLPEPPFAADINTLNDGESLPNELAGLKVKDASRKIITLPQSILKLSNEDLKQHIRFESRKLCGDEAKDEKFDAVAALVHDRHTFVLAGSGFGKTHIAEMYHNLFQPYQKSIVLVLNPLNSLGDNQVCISEKYSVLGS
ncbi:hypothetical protein PTTG_10905 [Puccinia triticina 1-1 BBBD Race 1]|uniref:ATP-dependent DNA helicase sgs1 n=1 Tax=Puccinia triticina (isolate 1-1 / race 1 (BBBD)) TaxID=630390 RepID=A0A0C4FCF3_PUCT1|nr:hypothetical protein PTTG_10905 [Puccinia triticina 1-1 BBBD Race 1]